MAGMEKVYDVVFVGGGCSRPKATAGQFPAVEMIDPEELVHEYSNHLTVGGRGWAAAG